LTELQFANTTRDYWIDIVNPLSLVSLVSRDKNSLGVQKFEEGTKNARRGWMRKARREKREGDRATAFLTRLARKNR